MPIPFIVWGLGAAATAFFASGCDSEETSHEDLGLSEETKKVKSLAEKLTQNAQTTEEKVIAIAQWAENNLFHYEDFGPGRNYAADNVYSGSDERYGGLNTISIDEIFEERAVGCHYASRVIISMLESIGVGAEYIKRDGHGLTYIPSLDQYIHGDYIADLACIPAEELLQSKEELDYWSQHPGFPASELGLPPELGMLSTSFYAFEQTMYDKYGSLLKLQRTDRSLHIFGIASDVAGFESAAVFCPEYDLKFKEMENGKLLTSSDYLPIQDLNALAE